MGNNIDNYKIISDKIHSLKETSTYLKNKTDDYAFSALAVKAMFYKNPALSFDDTTIKNIIVDGQYDGGVDALLSDPSSETSDLVIVQSKYYQSIATDDVFNAIVKMSSFYKDMIEGHYESVNSTVQKRFLDLNAEVGEESKIHFVFFTSAPQNGIKRNSLEKKFKDLFKDYSKIDLTILFGADIVESIKELESRRPTVESGKIKIDEANNYLCYGDDAIIVNVSAFSLKALYAQHNNNLLARNLRYHISGRNIDKAIDTTIQEEPETFWYKNNGITIICDDFDVDGKEVKLKNFSIVNGGQTTYMIHKSKHVSESSNFYLPCKIIKILGDTEDEKNTFSLEIAKATNSQKAIKAIDLKANSPEQVRFAQAMREIGIFYQTKRGEKVPADYKEPYLNTDLNEIGKLCLSTIFQMPGSSRNKPSTLYSSPYYETIFEKNQKKIASLSQELLYIDYFFRNKFIKQFDAENKEDEDQKDIIAFAHNSRTICCAFVMYASRVYNNSFTSEDIKVIQSCAKSDNHKLDLVTICENLDCVDSILPRELFTNKTNYEIILYDLFSEIIHAGFVLFNAVKSKDDTSLNATNFLKKDSSYYEILKSNSYFLNSSIRKIFKKAEDLCK